MVIFTIFCFVLFVTTQTTVSESFAGETFSGPVPAEIIKIIDGDTLDVRVQTWIGQYMHISVRIRGIDTPEFRGSCPKEKILARKARDSLASIISQKEMTLRNIQHGKYAGRILADIYVEEKNVADQLIRQSYARPYQGQKRQGWC